MNSHTYPTVSILTLTFNPNIKVLTRSLESIKRQKYPKERIEHIFVDGGSKPNIIRLMKSYGCKVIIKRNLKFKGEVRRSYGVQAATNDIIFWLESDNILEDENSLRELVQPFIDDSKIISSFPLHYGYNKHSSCLDRYSALFGGCDPVVFYLKKTDREPWYRDVYTKGKCIRKTSHYDVVEFDKYSLPTVGDNGFLTRRTVLLKADIRPEQYLHIDIYVDLLKQGYNRFAVVRSTSVEHVIGNSLITLVRRRMNYAERYTLASHIQNRRYAVYDKRHVMDTIRLFLYVVFSATFIQPLFLSIRGFLLIKDSAWFLHPIACFLFMLYYMKATVMASRTKKL